MRRMIFASMLLSLTAYAGNASGSVVFEYSGTVTIVYGSENTDGSVVVGTPVQGWYEFDLDTPDSASDNPNFGWYLNANDKFFASTGNYTLNSGLAHHIWNDIVDPSGSFDEYGLGGLGDRVLSNGVESTTMVQWSLDFFSYGLSFLASTSLPSTPPDITLLDTRMVIVGNTSTPEQFYFWADIDRLSLRNTAVPEPSSIAVWSFLALTGVGCGWWKKRKTA